MADNSARVMVLDLASGAILHVFKGCRDASVSWLPGQEPGGLRLALLSPPKRVLETWAYRPGGEMLLRTRQTAAEHQVMRCFCSPRKTLATWRGGLDEKTDP